MTNEDLSPMPTPTTEDPDLYPGGVDAVEDDPEDNGLGRDLGPDDTAALDDGLPEGNAEPAEKAQAAEGEADDAESGTTADDDPDAGQTAEDGSAEPPA